VRVPTGIVKLAALVEVGAGRLVGGEAGVRPLIRAIAAVTFGASYVRVSTLIETMDPSVD
jgi:hypothetical protein